MIDAVTLIYKILTTNTSIVGYYSLTVIFLVYTSAVHNKNKYCTQLIGI